MSKVDHGRWMLAAIIILVAIAACLQGCPNSSAPLKQPLRDVPFAKDPPKDASEWARLTRELDDSRAENARKDRELEAEIKRTQAAHDATWKRLGAYSWLCIVPGVGLLILSVVGGAFASSIPLLGGLAAKPVMATARILIVLGVGFAVLPWALDKYGDYAFYGIFGGVGLYAASEALVRIVAAWRSLKTLQVKANTETDPTQTAVHLGAAAGIMREMNPSAPVPSVEAIATIAALNEQVSIAPVAGTMTAAAGGP